MTRNDTTIATAAYADVFDYPLTDSELIYWHIGTGVHFVTGLQEIREKNRTFYVLPGKEKIVRQRLIREQYAKEKWNIVQRRVAWFCRIPTIACIGVTGALAMHNTKKGDDIDIIVITAPGTLWVTRLLVIIVADILRVRRKPGEKIVQDTLCFNMFMSRDMLTVPENEQDLFSAHEVLQMVPVFERHGTYNRFLRANSWVKKFLPNAWKAKITNAKHQIANKHQAPSNKLLILWGLRIVEIPARVLQLWYMQKRRSTEVIQSGVMRFHPKDARMWVKKKLQYRLKHYNIPLDKIFYHR